MVLKIEMIIKIVENLKSGIEKQSNFKNHVEIKRIVLTNITVIIYMKKII